MENRFLTGIFCLLLVQLFPILLFGQHPNVVISTGWDKNEPSITLNPKNPDQLVVGSNIDHYYKSDDGGLSWTDGIMSSSYGVWGDPCIVADTNENFYFFHLSNPPGGTWIDRIICQKMAQGTTSWTDGTFTYVNGTKQQDKEWASCNPYNNELYACWTQFDIYGSSNPLDSTVILFSKSADGGDSWSPPVRLSRVAGNCFDGDSTVEGSTPVTGPNGEIYTSWASLQGIMFDRSTDGGNTWLDVDILASDQPGGWDFAISGIGRCNGFPVTACDLSNSPYHGNLYINFSDQRNGPGDTDIWLIKSTDGGNTWSPPKRVNDDPPGKQQFFTWMSVDPITGYLYFVFYDRRNHSDDATDVYMAVSKDGGETFYNFKVSESPFIPFENVFFGDYNNVVAYGDVIRPVWTRVDPTGLSIMTALVDPTVVGLEEESGAPVSLETVFPNPFEQSTCFSYKVTRPCRSTLTVVDLYGRKVATLFENEYKPAGKYTEKFDTSQYGMGPGVYFFCWIGDNFRVKRQMLVIR